MRSSASSQLSFSLSITLNYLRRPLPSTAIRGFCLKMEQTSDLKEVRSILEPILPHLLNLYGSTATAQDFEIYAPGASFEDPLMRANGLKQIKSAFYSLPKVFSESKITEYRVEENITGPGSGEVLIDNKQHYKCFGKDISVVSLIKLNIQDGKIIRHEDWWDKKPLNNRDTVQIPLVGRLAEVTRRGSMLITHALMRFGRDPSP
ncbi:nuclear transport factor 2 (NTF2) family protein [Wolffia australiana]